MAGANRDQLYVEPMVHVAENGSPLFATSPVVVEPRPSPVVVVGLPRSGSSFLSSVISEIEDWYVFDDLYLFRTAKAHGVDGPLTDDQLAKLIEFLGWQVRARIKWGSFNPPRCSLADVDRMDEALSMTFRGRSVLWHELLEEWMTRLARHHGCSHWGYKAPQDFLYVDMLRDLWPGVRFIFNYRDPRRVMASMKYVNDQNGKPAQYHPLIYSRYWRMAAETMMRAGGPTEVHLVRFEELIADPNGEARKIAQFLGGTFDGEIERSDGNTSFAPGKRKSITPTEEWICERVAGEVMRSLDYPAGHGRLRLRDLPDLLWTSGRFAAHQLQRAIKSPAARQSIKAFVLRMLGNFQRQDKTRIRN
jgi:hypothetical protein